MKKFFLVIAFLLFPCLVEATIYWSSTGGGASSTCATTPARGTGDPGIYLTFAQGAACAVAPGDTLMLKAGNYGTRISGTASGTAGNPITIFSQTPAGARFNGRSDSGSFQVWDGLLIDCAGQTVNECVTTEHDFTLQNSEVRNCPAQCISSSFSGQNNNNTFRNNNVHDNDQNKADGEGPDQNHCFYLPGDNQLIEGNNIFNCSGFALHTYGDGSPGHTASGNTIRGNDIYNYGSGGIVITNDKGTTTNHRIYNNTIHDSVNGWGVQGICCTVFGTNHKIYNNVFYNTRGIDGTGGGSTNVVRNNAFFNIVASTAVSGGTLTATNNACNVGVSCGSAPVVNTNSPGFTNAAGGVFTLTAGSPLINAGTVTIATGVVIPFCPTNTPYCYNSTAPDIGAYEFAAAGAPPTVQILKPSPPPTYNTGSATLTGATALSGTATFQTGSTSRAINVSCDRCTVGTITGTTSWSVNSIGLFSGDNVITVTASDSFGTSTAAVLNAIYTPTFPGNTLAAAYGFEDGKGLTTVDSSGNGNTASFVNNPTWTGVGEGKYGNGILFNGTNQYLQISNNATLNFTQSFTISAWVQPTASRSDWRAIVGKNPYLYYALYGSIGGIDAACPTSRAGGFWLRNGGTAQYNVCDISSPLQPNVWTHLALTYDGASFKLYRNGGTPTTVAATGLMQPDAGSLLIAASDQGGVVEFFEGKLDEIRIYNAAIPQGSVTPGALCQYTGTPDYTTRVKSNFSVATVRDDMNCSVVPLAVVPPTILIAPSGLEIGSGSTLWISPGT